MTKDDGSGFTDKMDTACFGFKQCANDSECLPAATISACLKRGPALGNECWPRSDACSSDPHLRSKMTLENASGVPTDVCVACLDPLCESGQECTPPSSADGTAVLRDPGMISCVCEEGLCDQDKPPEYTCSMMTNKCELPF